MQIQNDMGICKTEDCQCSFAIPLGLSTFKSHRVFTRQRTVPEHSLGSDFVTYGTRKRSALKFTIFSKQVMEEETVYCPPQEPALLFHH